MAKSSSAEGDSARRSGVFRQLAAGSSLEPAQAAIAGAVARAVEDFAASEGVDAATAGDLTETGIDGALNYLDALMQFEDTKVQRALAFLSERDPAV